MSMRQLKILRSVTQKESISIDKYLQEIGKIKLLEPEEEVRLTKLIKKKDQNALDKLTKANLRFVVSVAKQYQGQGLSLPDLINEGNLGLIKAAQRYDETRGFKFISYAVWWIRQSILQALAEDSRIVRLPLNKVGLGNRIQKTYSLLEQEFEREPTIEELAEALEMDTEDVFASLGITEKHISIDASFTEDNDATLLDVLEDPSEVKTDHELNYKESLTIEIERSLNTLTERQKEVICLFFGIGCDAALSLEDIGKKYGLTDERVRQIKQRAIDELRKKKRGANLLKVFLG